MWICFFANIWETLYPFHCQIGRIYIFLSSFYSTCAHTKPSCVCHFLMCQELRLEARICIWCLGDFLPWQHSNAPDFSSVLVWFWLLIYLYLRSPSEIKNIILRSTSLATKLSYLYSHRFTPSGLFWIKYYSFITSAFSVWNVYFSKWKYFN